VASPCGRADGMSEKLAEIGSDFNPRHFERAGGNMMSTTFYVKAIQKCLQEVPDLAALGVWGWHRQEDDSVEVEGKAFTLRDYGCAEGDGTAILQVHFPTAEVIGTDISPLAVASAKRRWPTLAFEVGDIRDPKPADVIFTSHTVEHLIDPYEAIKGLLNNCQFLIVCVPPVADGEETHDGAPYTSEWLFKLVMNIRSTNALTICRFDTIRLDVENYNQLLEHHILLMARGNRDR